MEPKAPRPGTSHPPQMTAWEASSDGSAAARGEAAGVDVRELRKGLAVRPGALAAEGRDRWGHGVGGADADVGYFEQFFGDIMSQSNGAFERFIGWTRSSVGGR